MSDDRKRVFVVGLSRSGTTMIQGMLNSHPDIVSFPESHFFSFMTYDLKWRHYGNLAPYTGPFIMARLRQIRGELSVLRGKSNPYLRKRIELFLKRAELLEYADRFVHIPDRVDLMSEAFVKMLDEIAGSHHWVEKTPNHVFFTWLIEKNVPNAYFIHVIRKGEDALGSIMDAAQKYPSWAERHIDGEQTIPRLIALRNRAVRASLANQGKPNHQIISYERVVADPQKQAELLTDFLGLSQCDAMTLIDTSSALAKGEEPWKTDMGTKVKEPMSKFEKVFTPDEQAQIKRKLIPVPNTVFQRQLE